jgi:hypothetical protein
MPKKFVDWSDWKPGQGQPEDPASQPLAKTGKGKDVIVDQVRKILSGSDKIDNPGKQPTNEQLFGHLVVSQEQLEKQEKAWENKINDWFTQVAKPVEKKQPTDWGRGPIHKEQLTEEEERIRAIPVDPKLTEED